ncbi:Rne/Rng family ribonuclease [Fluviispira multicolorata]|uniref:Ribonuclease G n=1 Tax=Fluviispira multicolorata TaxID=2654512 RepID=A0A833JCT1_9BACT|nr:Rne/Rng family ribonuclease [Fluviispira multicolorata]KAB8030911.1 Rne/Rng family ribonuclease [Fluviispira multicolorata]
MVAKQLVINSTSYETRVALIEGGQVSEYYIERSRDRGIVGGIYKGKVIRVLPGMQSCFVDIGLERAAFLYGGDIKSEDSQELPEGFDEEGKPIHHHQPDEDENIETNNPKHFQKQYKITDLVKEGQEVLVQVAKDAIGTKGARVTTYLSLPGRYVVLMPSINHIGVSRRILSEDERTRLRTVVQKIKTEGAGIIVRTASENVPDEKITADIDFLVKLWETLRTKSLKSKSPCLVHEDLDLVFRATRDLISRDLDRIVIDDKKRYEDLVRFLNRFSVKLGAQVQLFQGENQIFDAFGIEQEVSRGLGSKVWLKSGGYLIIEQTEALTAIDVNTGRFVGSKSLGDTIVKTNLEAVKEIVQQLRLRNIGGIIILDFIDMDRGDDRDKVFQALVEELKKDKAKTTVLRISEMGLVQMTRKRTEESLMQKMTVDCPYCEGNGHVKSPATISYEVIRELLREFSRSSNEGFVIKAHPHVSDRLLEEDKIFLDELKLKYSKKVVVKSFVEYHLEHFEIAPMRFE